MDEDRQVWRGVVMNSFECKEKAFEVNTEFDQEPGELL